MPSLRNTFAVMVRFRQEAPVSMVYFTLGFLGRMNGVSRL